MMMVMTAAAPAAAASAVTTISGMGRKLMGGLQTETRLPKNSSNQLKTDLDCQKTQKMAVNGSKMEVTEVICLMLRVSWLDWSENWSNELKLALDCQKIARTR